jgi:hypothetical protein
MTYSIGIISTPNETHSSSPFPLSEHTMGISFRRDLRIAGYKPAVFKDALRGFMRTASPGNLIDLKTSLVLRRRVEKGSENWTLHAWFENLELYRSRKRVDLSTLPDLAAAAALILAVDAERMLRRAAEESARAAIQIRVRRELDKDMNAHFIDVVQEHLQTPTIRIEPEEWSGPPVSIVRS